MELTLIGKYRALVIRPDAELDSHTADKIRTDADRLIKKTGIKNVVFDMRDVSFMDSSGIGAILGRYRLVSSIGGAVAVFGMNKAVDRIMEMSGIKGTVMVTDKLQSALEEVYEYAQK